MVKCRKPSFQSLLTYFLFVFELTFPLQFIPLFFRSVGAQLQPPSSPSHGLSFFSSTSASSSIGASGPLNANSSISPAMMASILTGKSKGVKESVYYLGLAYLYGLSVPKNIPLALDQFLEAAELGHIEAHTAYATLLLEVKGKQDSFSVSKAEKYLQIAAAANDSNAKLFLARLYLENDRHKEGGISPSSLILAVEYLLSLTEKKDEEEDQGQQLTRIERSSEAHFLLGVIAEYGLWGQEQDYVRALEHYSAAVALGHHSEALYYLALMHAYGRGTPQDFRRSAALLLSGARASHAPSAYYLGILKTYGHGCAVDYEEAVAWFDLAAGLDDERVLTKAIEAGRELKRLLGIVESERRSGGNAEEKVYAHS